MTTGPVAMASNLPNAHPTVRVDSEDIPMTSSMSTPLLDSSLRLTGGFHDDERPHLLEVLAPIEKHLARWNADDVDLTLSVKERGGTEQRVTLEAKLGDWPNLVATAADRDLVRAVHE